MLVPSYCIKLEKQTSKRCHVFRCYIDSDAGVQQSLPRVNNRVGGDNKPNIDINYSTPGSPSINLNSKPTPSHVRHNSTPSGGKGYQRDIDHGRVFHNTANSTPTESRGENVQRPIHR